MTTEIKKEMISGISIFAIQDTESDIESLRCAIIDCVTDKVSRQKLKIYLLIDLSNFSAVNSTFFGALGATIQEESVEIVALCGMQKAVQRRSEQFGICDGGAAGHVAARDIQKAAKKFRFFTSVQEAQKAVTVISAGS